MLKRIAALALMMCLWTSMALAKTDPTPTPPPLDISQEVLEPPTLIRDMLDIAYHEWEELGGKSLSDKNKYTTWRGPNVSFKWCGGYVTWCMLQAGVPQEREQVIVDAAKETSDGLVEFDGIFHIKEANVGDLLVGYLTMNRTTNVPQPGYLLVYGASYNRYIHVGLVYDVLPLGNGKFRITTLEGNMSHTIKMYIRDYDMYADNKEQNLSVVPEDERTVEAAKNMDYSIAQGKVGGKLHNFYVNCFLMPWVPDDPFNELTTPTPPPQ